MHSSLCRCSLFLFYMGIISMIGCGPRVVQQKVLVPPRIDLKSYGRVGIYTFDCNKKGNLDRLCTQKFIERIQSLQPGTPIIELGVSPGTANPPLLQTIKQRGVDIVFMGSIDISNIKPTIGGAFLKTMTVEAEVEANLSIKLYETAFGASLLTKSGYSKRTVGHISLIKGSGGSFSASDPEKAYGGLVQNLINQVVDDFSAHYEYR